MTSLGVPGINLRKRILLLFLAAALAFIILAGRLAYIQFWRGPELQARALDNRTWNITVEPRRGLIVDRNGRELALSASAETVYVVPAEVRDAPATARRISEILGMSYDDAYSRVTRGVAWWYVKRKVTDEQARLIREADLPGIYLTQESRRVYPKGSLAAHILGFAGIDSQGLEGIEHQYDGVLRGRPGRIEIEFDAHGRQIPQALQYFEPPDDGHTLVLTIDENIQHVAERELERAMLATGSKSGMALVYEACTGAFLAMAARPTFDPNRYGDVPASVWRNPAVSDTLPPGSAFKPITAAAGLEKGVIAPSTHIYDPGHFRVPGHVIHNWNRAGLGATDFTRSFHESANTVFAKVAMDVGMDSFYEYLAGFGLTEPTGIDLPGEASGIRPLKENARPVDLAVMGFGQTLTVTPVQMVAATGALACGGTLMKPRIAREVRDSEGNIVRIMGPEPVRQVVSPDTAATIVELMEGVVTDGTGERAAVEGYRVGGKTGTSQKVVAGGYAAGKYIASFVGVAPVSDPRIVTYVVLDEPQGIYYGGWVAAPVVGAIMRDVLHYLEVPPDAPDTEPPAVNDRASSPTIVPSLVNLSVGEAREVLRYAFLEAEVEGDGPLVTAQFPAPGARVPTMTRVVLKAGGDWDEAGGGLGWSLVTVPDLAGMTERQAAEALGALNLRLEAIGSGAVAEQDPAPGAKVPAGTYVRIIMVPEDGDDDGTHPDEDIPIEAPP